MKTDQKFKRVYHHYLDWEELDYGMWSYSSDKKRHLAKAVEFTGNHRLYGRFMMRVVSEWHISCENALTDYSLNRKAWVGHAACALAIGCPEYITREAWGLLTDEQRILANKQAERAITRWEKNYRKDKKIRRGVGQKSLL